MKIPESYINDLIARVDIVEIIDHRVNLKKTGKNYSACCPFHDEKTPSFTANQEKQMYYCFGCGAGGNVIGFLIDYESLDFRTAVKQLSSHAGMTFTFDDVADVSAPYERRLTRKQLENANEDRFMSAIYEAAKDRGDYIKYSDHTRYKLAVNRLQGIANMNAM